MAVATERASDRASDRTVGQAGGSAGGRADERADESVVARLESGLESRLDTRADHRVEDRVFDSVAELFGILSTPIRLKIISAVCQGEKNVSELLADIQTTQPNMSQHLSMLYRAGVLGRRREGTQVYYRLQSERVAVLCRAVCTQVAIELDDDSRIEPSDRLMPVAPR